MTLVKSSKVGTILLHDHNAKLHVIAGIVASVHWRSAQASSKQRAALCREEWSPKDSMKLQAMTIAKK